MARARNIKPGFFTNDDLAEVDFGARILFVGLWCIADREGRLSDRPKKIKAEILPYDSCDVNDFLNQLAVKSFIHRYEIDGEKYIQIINFTKHQDPHYKEKASEIPPPAGHEDNGKTPGGVPEAVRQAIFERDGHKCKACGAENDLSLDHIIPRSKGGSHDESNLQTLCRRCNSGKNNRQAKGELDLSLPDDSSIIGQSSGNHRPTKTALIPDSLNPITDSGLLDSDSLNPDPLQEQPPAPAAATAAKKSSEPKEEPNPLNLETWMAYKQEYTNRYTVPPVRDAATNTKIKAIVKALGAEAPAVAAFFVKHNGARYVGAMHQVGFLATDYAKLRTEWATGTRMTTTKAQQADKTQTNGDVFGALMAEADAREAAHGD